MANSVDEYDDESFSQEPIVLETPRKRDYDETAAKMRPDQLHESTTTIQH